MNDKSDGMQLEDNRLLAVLPADVRTALRPHLEPVTYQLRDRVFESDVPLSQAVFVTSGLISIVPYTGDGSAVEVGPVGEDGMLGLPLVLDDDRSPLEAFAQIAPARGWRISAAGFREALARHPSLLRVLLRYAHWTQAGMAQWILCARLHTVEERMARWLLMCQDRVRSDHLGLTQEFLSMMLGVRRPSVTIAAGTLQKAGLITYRRGLVRVLDRRQLEDASCDCYTVISREYERLFGPWLRPDHADSDPPCDRCGADTTLLLPVFGSDGAESRLPLCTACWRMLERGVRIIRPKALTLDSRALRLSPEEARRYIRQGWLTLKTHTPDSGSCTGPTPSRSAL